MESALSHLCPPPPHIQGTQCTPYGCNNIEGHFLGRLCCATKKRQHHTSCNMYPPSTQTIIHHDELHRATRVHVDFFRTQHMKPMDSAFMPTTRTSISRSRKTGAAYPANLNSLG
ncbi:unnamed protein product [Ectocarpus sp. 8 AP-2014]